MMTVKSGEIIDYLIIFPTLVHRLNLNLNIVIKKNWIPKSKWAISKLKKEKYDNAIASKGPKCQKPPVCIQELMDGVVQVNRKE